MVLWLLNHLPLIVFASFAACCLNKLRYSTNDHMTILVLLPPQYWCYWSRPEKSQKVFTKCESSHRHISLWFASPPHLHRNASALFLLLPSIRGARQGYLDTRHLHEGSLFTAANWQFYFDTAYNSLVAWKCWIIAQGEMRGEKLWWLN